MDTDDEDTNCTVLVSLPTTYPATSPPQLQLLSRYIGAYAVDSALWGAVLRTYISSEGIEWVADTVCVFDGLEWMKERCVSWYGSKKSEKLAGELLREDERSFAASNIEEGKNKKVSELNDEQHEEQISPVPASIPEGIRIVEAEPIIDRKSAFVGRACPITDPAQVIFLPHQVFGRKPDHIMLGPLSACTPDVGQTDSACCSPYH